MANLNPNAIKPSKAPNLPIAPVEYAHQHFDILNNALRLYFNQIDSLSTYLVSTITTLLTPSAGTTANRPATSLQVGQTYFDTTLGIPIWWNGTNWINASGTTV